MKVLIFWDIYGRIWRKWFLKEFQKIYDKYSPDFVIANIENISSWRWPIQKHIKRLEQFNIDVYTSWNHIFDNEEDIISYLEEENSKLIRPINYYESEYVKIPWKWLKIVEKNWQKLWVINLISWIFLKDQVYNPFLKVDETLKDLEKTYNLDWIIVDFHRETTSEIYALSMFLDWRVSFVYWTHTHVQTNDELIFPRWTWMISDVWMSWPLYSVIWADFDVIKSRFLSWLIKWKVSQALWKDYRVNWVFIEIQNKKCVKIEKISIINNL